MGNGDFGFHAKAGVAESERETAVSYTHLDVYKRQAVDRLVVELLLGGVEREHQIENLLVDHFGAAVGFVDLVDDLSLIHIFTRPCQAVTGSRIDSSSDSAGTAGRTPAYASRVETASSGFTISSVYPPKAGFTGRITSPRPVQSLSLIHI